MFQIAAAPETYDAVVVGSGATGGWAAKRLAEAGLKVALLDAGRKVSPREFTEHLPAYKLKYRNLSPEVARRYRAQGAGQVSLDYDNVHKMKINLVTDNLLEEHGVIRHHSPRLAKLLVDEFLLRKKAR